jgi:hypothetical protein
LIGVAEFLMVLGANSPTLIFWIVVIVFAAIWLRQGGGRAERFLIAGSSLKIISNLFNIPTGFIPIWLIDQGYSVENAVSIASGCGIFLNVVSMAGITCLVYAFWIKFKAWNSERSIPQQI